MTTIIWTPILLLAVPFSGALVTFLLPKEESTLVRGVGLFTSMLTLGISLLILWSSGSPAETDLPWISSLGIHFHLRVDGISLWMLILTTFLSPIVLLSARHSLKEQVKEFVICFLVLETGMIGAFLAADLFLFYLFWEMMLIPMYLMIGIFGGERRVYASMKFVLYTVVGSLLMLAAILYLYIKGHQSFGNWSFAYIDLLRLSLSFQEQLFCFLAFAIAFCIKVPLFPLHTWLPDAHVEAPTAGSVILAGILLKFGGYGLIRYAIPLFPQAAQMLSPLLCTLAVIGIVYGSLVAYTQTDIKKLIAYSSVAHMGMVIVGIFSLNPVSISGAMIQMLAHGISTGGLFLCVGVLYDQRHSREMKDFGGIWKKMPVFGSIFLLFTLASIGLPGLCGFVGEFLTLLGVMNAPSLGTGFASNTFEYSRLFCAISATGVVLGAVYMLGMFQQVMLGPIEKKENLALKDVSLGHLIYLVPLALAAVVLGIYSSPVLKMMEPGVVETLRIAKDRLSPQQENHPLEETTPEKPTAQKQGDV